MLFTLTEATIQAHKQQTEQAKRSHVELINELYRACQEGGVDVSLKDCRESVERVFIDN